MKQEKIREILRTYLLPDCLKPQYDGMSLWEISELILKATEEPDKISVRNDDEPVEDKYANLKPEDDIYAK